MNKNFARRLPGYVDGFCSLEDSKPPWLGELPPTEEHLIGYITNVSDPTDIVIFGSDSVFFRDAGAWNQVEYATILDVQSDPNKIGPPFALQIRTHKNNFSLLSRAAYGIHSILIHPAVGARRRP